MRSVVQPRSRGALWAVLLRLALVTFVCAAQDREAFAQATPAPGEATAVIRIFLRPYDDSDESLSEIERLLLLNAPRPATVGAGDTISLVIAREFGFGAGDLPRTYSLLEKTILAWNRLDSPLAMRPGTLLIPDLPQKIRFNPAIATNRIPTSSTSTVIMSAEAARLESTQIRDATRLGAAGVEMYVSVPEPLVARYESAGIITVDTRNALPVHSLAINFSQDACVAAGSPPVLGSADRLEMSALLATARRQAQVFVLDTGWPSQQAQSESVAALGRLLQRVRQLYRLGQAPLLTVAYVAPTTNSPASHCVKIESALSEFEALDTTNRVEVVYVPLTNAQNAKPLLKELLEVWHMVSAIRRANLSPSDPSYSVPNDIRTTARRLADTTVNQLPDVVANSILQTQKSIVEAIIGLATETSKADGTFFIINESWWVERNGQFFDEHDDPHGAVVAAAGNLNKEIVGDAIEFARRSASSGFYVAALNVNANGKRVCNSNFVADRFVPGTNALGYVGDIAGDTGSSFSAARIAWLLAAAEALRSTAIGASNWHAELETRLRTLRPAGVSTFEALRVTPARLMRIWQ